MADDDVSASPTTPRTPSDTPTDDENLMVTSRDRPLGKIIEVKCGPLYAKMHVELFVCPGIHQACIELDGEMISPKEFTVRANKDKQKDWKGSIRIGKSNLRTLMEMRSFDFHNHSSFCSAKCQSRNYITPKEKDPDRDSRRGSTASQKASAQLTSLFGGPVMPHPQCNFNMFKEATTFSQLMQLTSVLNNNNNNNTPPSGLLPKQEKEELIDVDDSLTEVSSAPSPPSPEQFLRLMNTDPSHFWSEIQHLGLLDDAIEHMLQSLQKIREGAKHGTIGNAAASLTRVVSSLMLSDTMLSLIREKRNKLTAVLEKPRLSSDFSCLEDTDSRKRSIDEISHSSGSQSSPELKRPRVQYPAGVVPSMEMNSVLDPKLLSALVQAQFLTSQPPVDLLLSLAAPQPTPLFPDLGLKRDA